MTAIETACESVRPESVAPESVSPESASPESGPPASLSPRRSVSATWTDARIEALRTLVGSGLTCSQIAGELGVSRNAVIGKMNRLGLARGRTPAARRMERPGAPRPRSASVFAQRQILRAVYAEEAPAPEHVSVVSAARCSLLELARDTCRWPISDPAAADFAFCGNAAVAGLPYCAGHVRLAYRPPARRQAWQAQERPNIGATAPARW